MVLPNATECMRRYPQFAASLPFQFGSLYVPVISGSTTYGVLTVLRPSAPDATEVLSGLDRMTRLAEELGAALRELEDEHKDEDGLHVAWDGEAVCVQATATHRPEGRMARFVWDPVTAAVTGDGALHALLGVEPATALDSAQAIADVVAPGDTYQVMAALRATAAGKPPRCPCGCGRRTARSGCWTCGRPPPARSRPVGARRSAVSSSTRAPRRRTTARPICSRTVCSAWTGWVWSPTPIRAPPSCWAGTGRSCWAARCGRACPG